MPDAPRMAVLVDPTTKSPAQLGALVDAARLRGVEVSIHSATKMEEIGPAVDAAHKAGASALNVLASVVLNAHRGIIFERTAELRMPAIYQFPESAEQGGFAICWKISLKTRAVAGGAGRQTAAWRTSVRFRVERVVS